MSWEAVADWLVSGSRLLRSVIAALLALVLFWALVLGFVLVPVLGIGLPVLAGALGATRSLADACRRLAADVLGDPVPSAYASDPTGGWRAVLGCLRDPQTWRDTLWLAAHTALGFAVFLVFFLLGSVVAALFPDPIFVPVYLLVIAVVVWVTPWAVYVSALLARQLLRPAESALERRVAQLTEDRAATVDARAAELRRIERDLHDGAQARLAAVGMTLGLAAQALHTDAHRAGALIEEARADAARALAELRDLVRGIHPPVLADRGLPGGLEAAALLCPVPVDVHVELPARPDAPVESALYFAAAEALANVGHHSAATRAWLRATHDGAVLRVAVGDDGRGGADPARGTGLRGIERRLAAFDGTLTVASPPGGPTEITMELPCVLCSPRTTSSSATA